MDDQHRQPRDGDRKPVRDRIARAVRDGRISGADGQIRLTNVTAAQSMGELGLIVRDLDQLETVLQAAPTPAMATTAVPTAAMPGSLPNGAARRLLPLLVLGLVIAALAAGAIGLVVFSSTGNGSGEVSSGVLPEPLPISSSAAAEEPGPDAAPGSSYRLDRAGIQEFLAAYRARFGTTKVVDLTLYDEYVIVRSPVPGKNRSTGWRYADGTFSDFGPAMANFPGTALVDTARLDLAQLLRNIGTARRTLEVEDYTLTYVRIDYRPDVDEAPNVNIYVANEFGESGYLATTLTGRVERAYPYGG